MAKRTRKATTTTTVTPAKQAKPAPVSNNAPKPEPALEAQPEAPVASTPLEGAGPATVVLAPLAAPPVQVKTGHKRNLLLNADGKPLHKIVMGADGAPQLPEGIAFAYGTSVNLDKRQFATPLDATLFSIAKAEHDIACWRAEAAHMLVNPEAHKSIGGSKLSQARQELEAATAALDKQTQDSIDALVELAQVTPEAARKMLLARARAHASN